MQVGFRKLQHLGKNWLLLSSVSAHSKSKSKSNATNNLQDLGKNRLFSSVSTHTNITTTKSNGTAVPALLFSPPSTKKSSPAVIVLQEWWGVNEQIKKQASDIANKGYISIIPDLYRGKIGVDAEEAAHLKDSLDFKEAINDVDALISYIRNDHPTRKVGIIGFCMGGALTLASATLLGPSKLNAAVPFYGIPPNSLAELQKLRVPVQAHFGDLDTFNGFSDKETVNELEAAFKKGGVPYELYRYPTQGHAFMNDTPWSFEMRKKMGLPPYDSQVVSTAWKRVFDFFNKHLD